MMIDLQFDFLIQCLQVQDDQCFENRYEYGYSIFELVFFELPAIHPKEPLKDVQDHLDSPTTEKQSRELGRPPSLELQVVQIVDLFTIRRLQNERIIADVKFVLRHFSILDGLFIDCQLLLYKLFYQCPIFQMLFCIFFKL